MSQIRSVLQIVFFAILPRGKLKYSRGLMGSYTFGAERPKLPREGRTASLSPGRLGQVAFRSFPMTPVFAAWLISSSCSDRRVRPKLPALGRQDSAEFRLDRNNASR